jgi:peptidoglycan hydrolase-like protein with peptidoglycan-binding domain
MDLFGQILWNWGLATRTNTGYAPTGNILQDLANTYKDAQDNFFSSKRTVRCTTSDEVCKARHGVLQKNDQLMVCTSGPTAEPPSGCPGCILGLLYNKLGGQLVTKAVAIATDIADIADAPRRAPKMDSKYEAKYRTRPEVKRGDHGCPLPELQEKLIEGTGRKFKVTGKFDADTEAAVIAFQEKEKLLDSGARRGEADEKTWAALHLKVQGEHGLPKGEKFVEGTAGGWGKVGHKTQYDWYQVLEPAETDFSGCWVKEAAPRVDPSENTCCSVGPCPGGVTGGAWRVDDQNMYGPDTVGVFDHVVEGLRTRKKVPCGYVAPQAMVILRDPRDMAGVDPKNRDELITKSKDAEGAEYVRNDLLYKVTETDIRCGKRNKFGLNKSVTKYP